MCTRICPYNWRLSPTLPPKSWMKPAKHLTKHVLCSHSSFTRIGEATPICFINNDAGLEQWTMIVGNISIRISESWLFFDFPYCLQYNKALTHAKKYTRYGRKITFITVRKPPRTLRSTNQTNMGHQTWVPITMNQIVLLLSRNQHLLVRLVIVSRFPRLLLLLPPPLLLLLLGAPSVIRVCLVLISLLLILHLPLPPHLLPHLLPRLLL
ncbi:hypothetical protein F4680DRAFT_440490 [Xylaria scruposa]|nr:hypothetical protein F4680DRAFT_440490 [Xylaria scruposa]